MHWHPLSDFQWVMLIVMAGNLFIVGRISPAGRCGACGHVSVRLQLAAGRCFCPQCSAQVVRSLSQKIYLAVYAMLSFVFLVFSLLMPHIRWLVPYHYWLLSAFAVFYWGAPLLPFTMPATGKTLKDFPRPPANSGFHDYAGLPCPSCHSLRTLPEPMHSVRVYLGSPYHCQDCDCHFQESWRSRRYQRASWLSLGFLTAAVLVIVCWSNPIPWVLALVLFWILTVCTTVASMKPDFVVRD